MHVSGLLRTEKVDIEAGSLEKMRGFSDKTVSHVNKLFEIYGYTDVFGRSAVCEILKLQRSGASKLLAKLVQAGVIEPVSGHGKGKYRFWGE